MGLRTSNPPPPFHVSEPNRHSPTGAAPTLLMLTVKVAVAPGLSVRREGDTDTAYPGGAWTRATNRAGTPVTFVTRRVTNVDPTTFSTPIDGTLRSAARVGMPLAARAAHVAIGLTNAARPSAQRKPT